MFETIFLTEDLDFSARDLREESSAGETESAPRISAERRSIEAFAFSRGRTFSLIQLLSVTKETPSFPARNSCDQPVAERIFWSWTLGAFGSEGSFFGCLFGVFDSGLFGFSIRILYKTL